MNSEILGYTVKNDMTNKLLQHVFLHYFNSLK